MSPSVRLASWVVPPVLMAGVYTIFVVTSQADNTGKAWVAVGFGFVVVVWLTFRILVEQTALPRAVASGDAERLMHVTSGRSDATALVYRALAHELRIEWPAALAELDRAQIASNPPLEVLAASIRVAALVETGDIASARRSHDSELAPRVAKLDTRLHPMPHHQAALARARLVRAEGDPQAAQRELERIVNDIRAGEAIRARARALLGRG
jgi:hypothetical protein